MKIVFLLFHIVLCARVYKAQVPVLPLGCEIESECYDELRTKLYGAEHPPSALGPFFRDLNPCIYITVLTANTPRVYQAVDLCYQKYCNKTNAELWQKLNVFVDQFRNIKDVYCGGMSLDGIETNITELFKSEEDDVAKCLFEAINKYEWFSKLEDNFKKVDITRCCDPSVTKYFWRT